MSEMGRKCPRISRDPTFQGGVRGHQTSLGRSKRRNRAIVFGYLLGLLDGLGRMNKLSPSNPSARMGGEREMSEMNSKCAHITRAAALIAAATH